MTVVVDASVILTALTDLGERGAQMTSRLLASELIAPHLIDLEVVHGLRRHDRSGSVAGAEALKDFASLRIRRFGHRAHLPRIWELRHNLSAYDATYVALAETTETPLLTLDQKLANAPGHRAEVIVL